jgi:hypothetical protein
MTLMIRKEPKLLAHASTDEAIVMTGTSAIFSTGPEDPEGFVPWWLSSLIFLGLSAGILIYVAKTTAHLR